MIAPTVIMKIKELIQSITEKHRSYGIDINPPATAEMLKLFEQQMGFPLPADFVAFYTTCNGFGCTQDIFDMTPLHEIRTYSSDYGSNWFDFAEYMISSDSWGLRYTNNGRYEIFNSIYPGKPMTHSLEEFLEHFLAGNVFDKGGLYDWQEELGIGPEHL
ncbi:SMI1/KNR4 family protein [Niabella sp. CJ426]|uniref:SMI1/KNR4 family protein n=1 Tax=Niabella sp. CJ426 TaxID=3393740 RepID=UPI003CFBCDD7